MLNKMIMGIVCLLVASTEAFAAEVRYRKVAILPFEVPATVGLPSDYSDGLVADLIAELGRSKAFEHVGRADGQSCVAESGTLRLTGRITEFRRGNRAVRYMVGFGAGKTVLKAEVEFTDAETGRVVLRRSVDGKVIMGLLGGESMGATRGLAKEVAKVARKAFRN